MAKELEQIGAHILAIKDMAGLCKPYAAQRCWSRTLETGNRHSHPLSHARHQRRAGRRGAEGGRSGAGHRRCGHGAVLGPDLAAELEFAGRGPALLANATPALGFEPLQQIADYWAAVREFYTPFETGMLASTADVYRDEMPGGQYTNLYQQAKAIGLVHRWRDICRVYAEVNQLFGDIVKVTPSSKAVGDMALFMVTGDLTVQDVLDPNRELAFPESVVDLMAGRMGQPPGGFPPRCKSASCGAASL